LNVQSISIISSSYNKEINFPSKYRAEKLYRRTYVYDLVIHIKHNCSPAKKNKGSAIFLHIAKKEYQKTEGCVAISKKDFLKIMDSIILENIDKFKPEIILISAGFDAHKRDPLAHINL
jgi:L,D-peptidoglycan transpeptidase YkuD (ErfK/YbiS/YcfS/YnhG family)